jgi:hypothetical protein
MAKHENPRGIPLPRGWPRRVRSAMLHVIALCERSVRCILASRKTSSRRRFVTSCTLLLPVTARRRAFLRTLLSLPGDRLAGSNKPLLHAEGPAARIRDLEVVVLPQNASKRVEMRRFAKAANSAKML